MNKLRLFIGIFLVFALGALAGVFGMGVYIQHRFERFAFDDPRNGPPPPHPPMMPFLMRRLDKELDLTKGQKGEIEKIMNQTFENVHAIMEKQHPELEKLVEESFGHIKEKLNPEQKEKLERLKLFEKMRERSHRKHPFRPDFAGEKPDGLFTELKERLQLNDAQEEEILPIIDENTEKRQKIMEEYRRQDLSNRHEMENKMDELQETTEKQVEKILSDKQMDLYREMKDEQRIHMDEGMHPPIDPMDFPDH